MSREQRDALKRELLDQHPGARRAVRADPSRLDVFVMAAHPELASAVLVAPLRNEVEIVVGFIRPLLDRNGATLLHTLLRSVDETGSAIAGLTSDELT